MLLVSLSLVAYGLSGYLNAWLAVESSILGEPWKLIALSIGASLAVGYAYPLLRGVRKGDELVAAVLRNRSFAGRLVSMRESVIVTALNSGRKGGKIKLRMPTGLKAEGVITDYAGTLSPARVQLTESEVKIK
jgi:hypothetical protein